MRVPFKGFYKGLGFLSKGSIKFSGFLVKGSCKALRFYEAFRAPLKFCDKGFLTFCDSGIFGLGVARLGISGIGFRL